MAMCHKKYSIIVTLILLVCIGASSFALHYATEYKNQPTKATPGGSVDQTPISIDSHKKTDGQTNNKAEPGTARSSDVSSQSPTNSFFSQVVKAIQNVFPPYGETNNSSTPNSETSNEPEVPSVTYKSKPTFAYYYLWWSMNQWTSHLGPNYPYSLNPNPLPATLDSEGCSAVTNYAGNVMTDVSQNLSYIQDDYQVVYRDVKTAAQAGLTGFAVNWAGTGLITQNTSDLSYSRRLADVFRAVHQVNSEGYPFKILLNYKASATILTMSQFQNDFDYLKNTYGGDPALDHTYSDKIEIIIAGTWKYSDADINYIGSHFRADFYLIGDEKPATWNAARANNLDGTTYYWSSQNPYKNPASFNQLKVFATTVRSSLNPDGSNKLWLAPFAPGYNAQILYDSPTCVPRKGTQTLHELYKGNLPSNPDGWTLISWNEISEGTYVVPLTRYGTTYVDELRAIMIDGH